MVNVMLIDNRDNCYEYMVDDIAEALDRYIEEVLGFEKNFCATRYFWENRIKPVTESSMVFDDRVRLLNGLCKRDRYAIKDVLVGYTKQYPICISFAGTEGYRIFVNNREILGKIEAHFDDSVLFRVAAKKGYLLNGVYNNTDLTKNICKEITQTVEVTNIIDQVLLTVDASPLSEGDWHIELIGDNNIKFYSTAEAQEPVSEAFVLDGDGYRSFIKPVTKQYQPKIEAIYRDGVSMDSFIANIDDYYTFDKSSWVGTLNIDEENLVGHFRVEAKAVEYNATYKLELLEENNNGTISFKEIALDESGASTIQHWSNLSLTLNVADGYVIESVSVTMNEKDITDTSYKVESGKSKVTITNIIGDVVISVSTKASE